MPTLNLKSTVSLISGYTMPLLGFGVYQNYTTRASVLEAFKAAYRLVDSAQVYRNEAAVGEAVRDSGIDRGDLFISEYHSAHFRDTLTHPLICCSIPCIRSNQMCQ